MRRIQKKKKRQELIGIWLQSQYPYASFTNITIIIIMRMRIPKITNDEDPFLEKNKRRQDLIGISLQSQHLISSSGSDRLVVTNDFNPYMYKVSGSWHHSFMCIRATWLICRHATSLIYLCVTWRIHVWDMIYPSVWLDSLICVTWLIDSVTWLIDMCDMTHSYVWHGSFICVTWLIHMFYMAHSYMWHGSFIHVTWLIHMCDMTHITWMETHGHACDMTHSHACDMTYFCASGSDMTHEVFMCLWERPLCRHEWLPELICVYTSKLLYRYKVSNSLFSHLIFLCSNHRCVVTNDFNSSICKSLGFVFTPWCLIVARTALSSWITAKLLYMYKPQNSNCKTIIHVLCTYIRVGY